MHTTARRRTLRKGGAEDNTVVCRIQSRWEQVGMFETGGAFKRPPCGTKDGAMNNPRYSNGNLRRKYRARFKAMRLPCAVCGRPIHYDEPSDSSHPLSFVIDEIHPVSRYWEFGYPSKRAAAEDWNNLQPCHYVCNQRKSARTMNELSREGVRRLRNLPDGAW